jgi:hypothetical protein
LLGERKRGRVPPQWDGHTGERIAGILTGISSSTPDVFETPAMASAKTKVDFHEFVHRDISHQTELDPLGLDDSRTAWDTSSSSPPIESVLRLQDARQCQGNRLRQLRATGLQ